MVEYLQFFSLSAKTEVTKEILGSKIRPDGQSLFLEPFKYSAITAERFIVSAKLIIFVSFKRVPHMKTVARYASMVKFSHTIFALPFAMAGYTYGVVWSGDGFEWLLLVKVLLAMVFARNMAMGFNRWLDRDIDARNPRTAGREIPARVIPAGHALAFVIVNLVMFELTTLWINSLAFYLSPIVLVVLLGYSYTKRFTAWSHLVLGCALAIAPTGAFIAVTGAVALVPVLISALVFTWVSGFDIIYSLQDMEFDRENGLHSVPARFGVRGSLAISIVLHAVSIYAVYLAGIYMYGGTYYLIGAAVFALTLVYQHIMARPSRIERIGAGFTLTNGVASICYAAFAIVDMLL